jgi:hypothetical protein
MDKLKTAITFKNDRIAELEAEVRLLVDCTDRNRKLELQLNENKQKFEQVMNVT